MKRCWREEAGCQPCSPSPLCSHPAGRASSHQGWHQPSHLPSLARGCFLSPIQRTAPVQRDRERESGSESFEERSCPSSISWDELCALSILHRGSLARCQDRETFQARQGFLQLFKELRVGFSSLRLLTQPGVAAGAARPRGDVTGGEKQGRLWFGVCFVPAPSSLVCPLSSFPHFPELPELAPSGVSSPCPIPSPEAAAPRGARGGWSQH